MLGPPLKNNKRLQENLEVQAAEFGYKAANLAILTDNGFIVPPYFRLKHQLCFNHLSTHAPEWISLWEKFKLIQGSETSGLKEETHEILDELRKLICITFINHPLPKETLQFYLENNYGENEFLVVRSTGKEDSSEIANPGGNESYSGILPTTENISEAIGKVIASYFSEKSLEQRLKSKKGDTILAEPFMPMLLQKMIRETPDGMVYSGVMYTGLRGTRIQAAPGHGEYVVNSKGPIDSYFVTREGVIHQQISQKPTRMVLEVKQGESHLTLEQNSDELRINSTLPIDVVKRLNTIGKKIEELYEEPRDVEFVYDTKSDEIFIVQARPIPKGLSEDLIPSAIAPEHIKKVKEEADNLIKAKVITPAGYSARIIESEGNIIIRPNISAALDEYLSMKDEVSAVKAIVVLRDAPGTSHEAAQFNSVNVPVFFVSKSEAVKIQALLKQEHPKLIFDAQRGLIVDWHERDENEILKDGFFKSSISPERTIIPSRHTFEISEKVMEEGYSLIYQGSEGKLKKKRVFEHIESLLEDIESVKAGEVEGAKESLSIILRYFYNIATSQSTAQNSRDKYIKEELFRHACIFAVNISHQLDEIAKLKDTLPEELQRELLDLVNGLEALVVNPGRKNMFSHSIYQTLVDKRARIALAAPPSGAIFNHLPPNIQDDVINLYHFGNLSTNKETFDKWTRFVLETALNSSQTDDDNLEKIKKIVLYAAQNNLGTILINLTFKGFYEPSDPQSVIQVMELMIKRCKELLEKHGFWKFESIITEFESKVSLWSKKRNYLALNQDFNQDFNDLLEKFNNLGDINKLSLYAKAKISEEIERLTEVVDTSIKSLKGSPDYQNDRDLQAQRFSEMLSHYHQLMVWMIRNVPDQKFKEWQSHVLSKMTKEELIECISVAFKNRQKNASSIDLAASGYLSVNSATIDSPADFIHLLLENIDKFTLEDFFTLFHQNILASLAALRSVFALSTDDFPPMLRSFHNVTLENIENIRLISTKVTGDYIILNYNIPLRDHAARLNVSFNKKDGKMELQIEIYGKEIEGRMKSIQDFANLFMQKAMAAPTATPFELTEPVSYSFENNTIQARFIVNNNESIEIQHTLINLIQNMTKMTFNSAGYNLLNHKWILSDFEPEISVKDKIFIMANQYQHYVWDTKKYEEFFKYLLPNIDKIDVESEKDLQKIFDLCSDLENDIIFSLLFNQSNSIGTKTEWSEFLNKCHKFPNLTIGKIAIQDFAKLAINEKNPLENYCQLIDNRAHQFSHLTRAWNLGQSSTVFRFLLSDEINPTDYSKNQLQVLLNNFVSNADLSISFSISSEVDTQFCTHAELIQFAEKYSLYPDLSIGNMTVEKMITALSKSNFNIDEKEHSNTQVDKEEKQKKKPLTYYYNTEDETTVQKESPVTEDKKGKKNTL